MNKKPKSFLDKTFRTDWGVKKVRRIRSSKGTWVGVIGESFDNASDLTGKKIQDVTRYNWDIHLISYDGTMMNLASAMASLLYAYYDPKNRKKCFDTIMKYNLRMSWHEPDESDVSAYVTKDGNVRITHKGKVIWTISSEKLKLGVYNEMRRQQGW